MPGWNANNIYALISLPPPVFVTPVTHLFSAIYRGPITPLIIGRNPPCTIYPKDPVLDMSFQNPGFPRSNQSYEKWVDGMFRPSILLDPEGPGFLGISFDFCLPHSVLYHFFLRGKLSDIIVS